MFALSSRRVLSCVLVSSALLFRFGFAEDAVPQPLAINNKDVTAFLAVPDLKALIATVEGIAAKALPPNQFQPGMLSAMIGGKFGDPTLASLANKPVVIMLFKLPAGYNPDEGPPPMALFIPVNPDSPLLAAMKDKDKVQMAYEDGLLIAAPTAENLAAAKAAKAVYGIIADAKLQSSARLYVSIAAILDTYNPLLKAKLAEGRDHALASLKNDPPPPDVNIKPETAEQAVKLFFKGLEGFLDQCDATQVDLTIKPDSITLEKVFTAKSGTLLADFLSGTPVPTDKNLESYMTKGFEMVYAKLDNKALAAALKKAVAAIAADPEIADLAKHEMVASMLESAENTSTEGFASVGGTADGLNFTAAGKVVDEKKYLAMFEKAMGWFAPDALIGKVYAQMGIKLDFVKNAREHNGTGIQQLTIHMDQPNMPPDAAAMMKKLIPTFELTATKGYYMLATTPAAMDMMIDKAVKGDFPPSGVSLKSTTVFGTNKNMYLDYDVLGYMKFVMSMAGPNNPGAAIFNQLKSTDPLLMSYAQGNGRAMFQIQIPLAPVMEGFQMYQKMAAGGGAPPAAPETENKTF